MGFFVTEEVSFSNIFTEQCGVGSDCVMNLIAGGQRSCEGQFPWMVNISKLFLLENSHAYQIRHKS
jgi:hypothetical protein